MHYIAVLVMIVLCVLGALIELDSKTRSDFYPDPDHVVVFVVGFVLVYWFYSARFAEWSKTNAPPVGFPAGPTSHFTTRVRYHLFVLAYASLGFAALFMVYGTPQGMLTLLCEGLSVQLAACDDGYEGILPGSIQSLALGFAVALALLGVPMIEERWRSALQRAADIPSRATNLVTMLHQKFHVFAPDETAARAFLRQYNAGERPRLFMADIYTERDEGFLETYPRSALILYELSQLDVEQRRLYRCAQFAGRLDELRDQLAEVRRDIGGLHHTLDQTLGLRFSGDFSRFHYAEGSQHGKPAGADEALHAGATKDGERTAQSAAEDEKATSAQKMVKDLRKEFSEDFGDRAMGEYAITRLDNILVRIKGIDEGFAPSDEELRQFLFKRLQEISARSEAIYFDVLKIVVLMSFRSSASPHLLLEFLGFRLERGEADQTEVGPWLVIIAIGLSLATSGIFFLFYPSSAQLVLTLTLCMLGASFLGGFVVANLILGARIEARRSVTPTLSMWDRTMIWAFPTVSALFSLVVLQKFYFGPATAAMYYVTVTGCYGAYIAFTVIAEAQFRDEILRESGRPELPDVPTDPRRHWQKTHDCLAPLKMDGIAYDKSNFRWLAISSAVFASIAMIWTGVKMPLPFLLILFISSVLIPGSLVALIWMLERERLRKSTDDGPGTARPSKLLSRVGADLAYLFLVSPFVVWRAICVLLWPIWGPLTWPLRLLRRRLSLPGKSANQA